MIMEKSEGQRLDDIASRESNLAGFNGALIKYRHMSMEPHILRLPAHSLCYDIGAGEGANIEYLASRFARLTAFEPASTYFKALGLRIAKMNSQHRISLTATLVEEARGFEPADCAVSTCVLEHVPDPVAFLQAIRGLLKPTGLLLLTVPNAESLHRRLGIHMGLLHKVTELQAHDAAFGHLRYYTFETLAEDIAAAGFELIAQTGVMLKPLPNAAMENLDTKYIDALFGQGIALPRYCAEIFVAARPAQ